MSELQVERSRLRAEVEAPERFERFDPRAAVVPTLVTAGVDGGSVEGRAIAIAIAINGRIAATSVGFKGLDGHDVNISALVPELALRPGRNRLDLFEVRDPRRRRYCDSAGRRASCARCSSFH